MLPPSARENVVFEVLNNTVATSIFRYYGKGFFGKGTTARGKFQKSFSHNSNFLNMDPDFKDLHSLQRSFSSQCVIYVNMII